MSSKDNKGGGKKGGETAKKGVDKKKGGEPEEPSQRTTPRAIPADRHQYWLNPCDYPEAAGREAQPRDDVPTASCRYFKALALDGKHGYEIMVDLLREILDEEIKDENFHDYTWFLRFEFLPDIETKLENIQLNLLDAPTQLARAFQNLQYFAVAMEQVVEDQKDHSEGAVLQKCQDVEVKLKQAGCSLVEAMRILSATKLNDVARTQMPEAMRDVTDRSTVYLHNFIIARDLGNFFRWLDYVFDYFHKEEVKQGAVC